MSRLISLPAHHLRVTLLLIAQLVIALPATAEMVDRVVAVVNDDIITLSELEREASGIFQQIASVTPSAQLQSELARAREEVLDTLIDKRLIAQKAEAQDITVTDEEVDQAFAQILSRNRMSKEELLAKLRDNGIDEKIYRTTLRSQLLQNKLISLDVHSKVVVTEEMILDHYDTNYTQKVTDGGYYLLQMGFVWQPAAGSDSPPSAESSRIDARKRAEQAHKMALAGKDFKALAQQYSDLPSKEDGGDIGVFQPDEMASYMRAAVVGMKPGEISEIIETPAGFQFFKVISVGEGALVHSASLASVKEEIRQELFEKEMQEALAEWVKELKEDAYIQKL